MATPRGGYWHEGVRLPSVTGVLSRFKESGALIHWAWNLGKEGKDYRTVRDGAASSGTLAHELIERHVLGQEQRIKGEGEDAQMWGEATIAFGAFREWYEKSQIKVTATELGLKSIKHGFGGTLDFTYSPNGLGDFKTSARIYADAWLQLGGYKILHEENGLGEIKEGRIARFDKVSGKFQEQRLSLNHLEACEEGFLALLRAFKSVKTVECLHGVTKMEDEVAE